LVTGDVVAGGAGTDTINSRHTVTADLSISAKISDVEIHNVRIDHDGAAADVFTYDMADVTGATKVVMDRAVNSAAVADAIFTISGKGFTTAVTTGIAGGDTGADNSAVDLTATYQSVSGSTDSATLELNGGQANVVTIAGIETLNISALTTETSASSTGASKINSLQAADATTVNISGAGAVRLSGTNAVQVAANFAATVTVDATTNTGGVNFLSETNTLTFKGGTGADAVFMAATLTAADTLTGGATGTDTIGITTATTTANGAGVSGFEIIDIGGATTPTIDLDSFANNVFTGLAVSVETGTVTAINNLASGSTFTIGGVAAITAASDITIGIKGAALAGRNSDSLAIVVTGTGAVDYGTLVVASTETLTIASGGVTTGNSIAVLTAAAATTLTLTGASALEITAFTTSAVLSNINASAMTGAFVMGAAGANTAATAITGGSGADTLIGNAGNDVIVGGAGIDTITGGAGGDDITGGDGADVFTIGARTANSVAASATSLTATIVNGDSMTFANGVDIIRGFTTGSDTLAMSAAVTAVVEGVVPTTLIGATAGALAENVLHGARGNFVAATSVFTFSATGTDFFLTLNDATAADDVLSTTTNAMILIGVTALVAADIV
jgi:Ca2+-binding RTX toxin-like protein